MSTKYIKNKSKKRLTTIANCDRVLDIVTTPRSSMHVSNRIRPTGIWERTLVRFIVASFTLIARVLYLPCNVGIRVCRTAGGAHWTRHAARYNHDLHRVEVNVRNIGFRNFGVYLKAVLQSSLVAEAYARGYVGTVTGARGRRRLVWTGPTTYASTDLPRGSSQRFTHYLTAHVEHRYGVVLAQVLDAMGTTADELAGTEGYDADTAVVLPNFTPTIRRARADSAYSRYRSADGRGITWYHRGRGPLAERTVGLTRWVDSPLSALTGVFKLY